MKYFIVLIIGEVIGGLVYQHIELPNEIEKRARELNLLKYDSKQNKFIIKDSVYIDNFDLEYLKNGTMNKNNK